MVVRLPPPRRLRLAASDTSLCLIVPPSFPWWSSRAPDPPPCSPWFDFFGKALIVARQDYLANRGTGFMKSLYDQKLPPPGPRGGEGTACRKGDPARWAIITSIPS